MAFPPYDYYARRTLPDNIMPGYRAGDGMYADAAEQYGWILGVDIDAARPDVLERPADGASREAWVNYVLTQKPGAAREEFDDLGRNDLIALVTKPEKESAEKTTARKATKAAAGKPDAADTSESGE